MLLNIHHHFQQVLTFTTLIKQSFKGSKLKDLTSFFLQRRHHLENKLGLFSGISFTLDFHNFSDVEGGRSSAALIRTNETVRGKGGGRGPS